MPYLFNVLVRQMHILSKIFLYAAIFMVKEVKECMHDLSTGFIAVNINREYHHESGDLEEHTEKLTYLGLFHDWRRKVAPSQAEP